MSVFIAGSGWVTPLGSGVSEVWNRLLAGDEAEMKSISDTVSRKSYPIFRVPESALENLPRHARLRRASNISRFAVAAGLAALEDAKTTMGRIDLERTALVFGVANGGVIYTKRFYHDIANSGAQAASPLLFPETVFNAPASHLAAILGIDGASYTLVADGTVGILAIQMAEDLLASGTVDHCLVVVAEEADWILCDGYHRWRMLRNAPPIEPFQNPPKGTILSEGAGALLISNSGQVEIESIHRGGCYIRRRDKGGEVLKRIVAELATSDTRIAMTSANGTFIDILEADAVAATMSAAVTYSAKPALGESVGASALWQVIAAARAVQTKQLPALLHSDRNAGRSRADISFGRALVLTCGLNQQAAGLRLRPTSGAATDSGM